MRIKDILARIRENKLKYKEYKDQRDIENKYEERLKSANERELERFMREKREDNIKKELEEFRKARQHQAQYGNQIIKVKNMFAPKDNRISILKQKNLFSGRKKRC